MKKLLTTLLLLVIAMTFANCGQSEPAAPQKSGDKIGALTPIGMSEEDVKRWTENVATAEGKPAGYVNPHTIIFFDDVYTMVAALKSKQIDRFAVCRCVGTYIVAQDDELKLIDKNHKPILGCAMAMLKEANAQVEEINAAIESMKEDGTLDKLIKENITDLGGNAPDAKPIDVIEGAPTIKVAVTGDLPPMDFVLPDGTPAGFNVAFLNELSKRINKNFELVKIDANARSAALSSGQVDALFWVVGTYDHDGKALSYPLDKMEGVTVSVPYIIDSRVAVTLK